MRLSRRRLAGIIVIGKAWVVTKRQRILTALRIGIPSASRILFSIKTCSHLSKNAKRLEAIRLANSLPRLLQLLLKTILKRLKRSKSNKKKQLPQINLNNLPLLRLKALLIENLILKTYNSHLFLRFFKA